MVDFSSAIVTTFTGLIGVVIGAILSNYVNQKIARQAAKKDVVFKKKIEYFENIVRSVGTNIKLYRKSIKQLEAQKNKANIKKILKNLKQSRLKFEMLTSPLYMDPRRISIEIKKFVGVEKIIFKCFERMQAKEDSIEELTKNVKISFKRLQELGNSLTIFLRNELAEG